MTVRPKVESDKVGESAKSSPRCRQVFEHTWRRSLFVPRHIKDVADYRVTKGTYEDGEQFILSDDWRSSKRPERDLSKRWKGSIEFIPSPQIQESEAPNSAARWLTPRSPGNSRIGGMNERMQEEKTRREEIEEPARGSSMESPCSIRPYDH